MSAVAVALRAAQAWGSFNPPEQDTLSLLVADAEMQRMVDSAGLSMQQRAVLLMHSLAVTTDTSTGTMIAILVILPIAAVCFILLYFNDEIGVYGGSSSSYGRKDQQQQLMSGQSAAPRQGGGGAPAVVRGGLRSNTGSPQLPEQNFGPRTVQPRRPPQMSSPPQPETQPSSVQHMTPTPQQLTPQQPHRAVMQAQQWEQQQPLQPGQIPRPGSFQAAPSSSPQIGPSFAGPSSSQVPRVDTVALQTAPAAPAKASAPAPEGGELLCSALVVQQAGGVSLAINGLLQPCQQEEVLSIVRTDNTQEAIMRIFISETNNDSGILLESAKQFPIAFMDTGRAVSKRGEPPRPSPRSVAVSRISPAAWEPSHAPYAVFEEDIPNKVVARRGTADGSKGPLLLEVLQEISGDSPTARFNVFSARGVLMAACEVVQTLQNRQASVVLHIARGVDAGLIICSVVAAIKLRPAA